ncbi:protein disulfide-isomerase precursor [Thoreauomyces humboldtii]|nr:protein disulfide-isomerase precursor [Thoreauomyces humboldtii]
MKASSLFLCALAAVGSVLAKDSSDVLVLDKSNFDATAAAPLSLIEFYAPWCGHCKSLAPEYEKAATELKPDVILGKVDCTEQTEICEKYGVQGYPTLKVFREGEHSEFKGQRKADSIVSYMKKQNLPAVSDLSAEKIKAFAESDKVVVVGFFADKTSAEYLEFEAAANELRDDFLFGATITDGKDFGVVAPGIALFKKFDEEKTLFDGSLKKADIAKFVKTNSVPLMADIGPENYATYVQSGLPIAYLFVGGPEDRKSPGADVEKLAKEYQGKISFVYIDGVQYAAHAKNLGVKEHWPAFVIQEPEANLRFPYDQDEKITKKDLKKFLDDYVGGKLEALLKSAAIPEDNSGPVKVVVGKTYESIVLDKSADVLVEFYAPWCGHCKNLAPIWEELGSKVGSKKVVIAKLDATENDVPGLNIEGFPTIKLFKAKDNEIVDYNGDRTLEGFVSFLKEHAVHADSVVEASGETVADDAHEEL